MAIQLSLSAIDEVVRIAAAVDAVDLRVAAEGNNLYYLVNIEHNKAR
jgi:hypothetical protein